MKLEDNFTKEDLAFKEAITTIIKRRKFNPKKAMIYVKFIGGQLGMSFHLLQKDREPVSIRLQEFITRKMMSLRMTPERLLTMFEAFHFSMMRGFKLEDHKKLYYIVFNTAKDKKPAIGAVLEGKSKIVKTFSDILAILGEGDEQLN